MGSSKIKVLFKKNSKSSIIPVECDWKSKNSENVQHLCFLIEKNGGFSEKKVEFSQKVAERSKFTVKRDWKNTTSQNVQKLVKIKKIYGFAKKNWFCRNRQS